MLPHLNFNETEMLAFALILIRISAFLASWPVFSVYNVPNHAKVLLAVMISMVVFPVIDRSHLMGTEFANEIIWLAGKEVLTGLCLGFLTRLMFFAVAVAGNLIATSIGVANAQVFNPSLGSTVTTTEQFYLALATLLFLAVNGHHYFLTGLVQSFDAVPLSLSGTEFASLTSRVGESGLILQTVTTVGIKISAPILVAIFLMNVVMGIVGRAVPQINVLITSMNVNFMAGMFVMIIAIPAMVLELEKELMAFTELLFSFMRNL